jgi:hypothetical protein
MAACRNPKCRTILAHIATNRLSRDRSGVDRSEMVCILVHRVGTLKPTGTISAEMLARTNPKGIAVSDKVFTRTPDQSQANSLRLYVDKVIIRAARETGIPTPNISDLGIVVREGTVMIYRKR